MVRNAYNTCVKSINFSFVKLKSVILLCSIFCVIICFITLPVNAQLKPTLPPAANYWQGFDFNENIKEQPEFLYGVRSFLAVMQEADTSWQYSAIDGFLFYSSVNTEAFRTVAGLLTTFYNDPNSQLRNIFIARHVLEEILNYSLLEKIEQEEYKLKLDHVCKNFPGDTANDFSVISPDGNLFSLFDKECKYTLLYFYNPGCHACEEISDAILRSHVINEEIKKDQLEIVAVYTDLEKDKWLDFVSNKSDWIHGWDKSQQIEGKGLYYFDAIPTMYLLDKEKIVLLKDCTLNQVENYLYSYDK